MFISFEGIEAAGKSMLVAALGANLRLGGENVLVAREPGGTSLGDEVRRLFLDPTTVIDPLAEVFLLNASRAQLVDDVLGPALRAGRTVLCDRFFDATLAYQGYGRGLDVEMLLEVCLVATSRIAPDLTFLLDIPADVSWERVRARGSADRLEREGRAFHSRVRDGYLALAERFPQRIVVIDATRRPEEVEAQARSALAARLPRAVP